MANAGQALAKALGVFTETLTTTKQKQLDDENEARIRNFYMNQAEKQEERARAAELRSIEDQKRQEMVYDQALAAKRTEREAMLSQMAKMGISGTPEELAARVDIENLTREERQRKEEATKRAERETLSKETNYLDLVKNEYSPEAARKIADIEAVIEKGEATPEMRALHADLVKQGNAEARTAKDDVPVSIPDSMVLEIASNAAKMGKVDKFLEFEELRKVPKSKQTPEWQAKYATVVGELTPDDQQGGDVDSQIREINFMMDELAKSGGGLKDPLTSEYSEPTEPAQKAKWQMYKTQKDQLLGIAQAATEVPIATQKRDEGLTVVKNLAAEITKRSDGHQAQKLFMTMPGRDPIEWNSDDPNLGRVLLNNKDAKVEFADGPEQIKMQGEAAAREGLADSSLLGLGVRSIGKFIGAGKGQSEEVSDLQRRMMEASGQKNLPPNWKPDIGRDSKSILNRWLLGN